MSQTGETAAQQSPGETIRDLMRSASQITLSTALTRDGTGRPYASLALVALDHDATPLLLLSDLADHTANLMARPQAALLFDGTAGYRDPLAGPRASVLGSVEPTQDPRLLARFVRRHPAAELYAGFKDFNLYRLKVERAHLVAGFGRIHWVEAREVLLDVSATMPLATAEAGILDHMNADHADAVALIGTQLLSCPAGRGEDPWVMTGIDPEGCDLRCGTRLLRVGFDSEVRDAETARVELVRLTRRARSAHPGPSGRRAAD